MNGTVLIGLNPCIFYATAGLEIAVIITPPAAAAAAGVAITYKDSRGSVTITPTWTYT